MRGVGGRPGKRHAFARRCRVSAQRAAGCGMALATCLGEQSRATAPSQDCGRHPRVRGLGLRRTSIEYKQIIVDTLAESDLPVGAPAPRKCS